MLANELTSEFKHVSHDECDTCANYARLSNGKVEIQTLYRFGKPSYRTVSKIEFYRLMNAGLL